MANYWIIGASDGIGKALTEQLAQQGHNLVISARSEDKLQELASTYNNISVAPLDVTNEQEFSTLAEQLFEQHKLNHVIFMPALYNPMSLDNLNTAQTKKILDVNLLAVFHLIAATYPKLKAQGYGQLAICASIAGVIGLPNGQPYSATKAAVINLVESLYYESKNTGVDIKLINPGFVRTRLTNKNTFKMPFRIEPEEAAQQIINGLNKKGLEIHFPKAFTYILKTLTLLPRRLLRLFF